MESNYGSESNYDYGRTYNSRTPASSYTSYSSESQSYESRTTSNIQRNPTSSNRNSSNSGSIKSTNTTPQRKYNTLEDINELIARLEASISKVPTSSYRVNEVLESNKRKIEMLKGLVEQAKMNEEEERMIRELQQNDSDLDAAIESIQKGLHR